MYVGVNCIDREKEREREKKTNNCTKSSYYHDKGDSINNILYSISNALS